MQIFEPWPVRNYPLLRNLLSKREGSERSLKDLSWVLFRPSDISNMILPLLVLLSKDENLLVRQSCVESLLDISERLTDEKSIEHVVEMIVSLVKFGLSSKTTKFINTIASRLADLCQTFASKRELPR